MINVLRYSNIVIVNNHKLQQNNSKAKMFESIQDENFKFSSTMGINKDHEQRQQNKRNIFQIYDNDRYIKFIDCPRQIPTKSYSLIPDIITGWKPKKKYIKHNIYNIFPLNYPNDLVDYLIKYLFKKKNNKFFIVFLGPRKCNSYLLHQRRNYQNPYPNNKKIQAHFNKNLWQNQTIQLEKGQIQFYSDFQCGNLDAAIKVGSNQFDLFMRVDSNTKGHTNWYYFQVKNKEFIGPVKFHICNFRKALSLYQRGMKPYIKSYKNGNQWQQKGNDVIYDKKFLRYEFLYREEQQSFQKLLSTHYTLTFTYNFQYANDKVLFAYSIPYTYTTLLNFVKEINIHPFIKCDYQWKSLSGLAIPVLQITDFDEEIENKTIVLIVARIHPGQSNSSYVCQGFIKALLIEQLNNKNILKQFHFYIVPMVNPDGVVAGNYRTSLFGKDLNRTFHQCRKYAYPQTLHLVQLAKTLKRQHKERFTTYLDLHGHSVKKNVFFYGPDYNLNHFLYQKSRQFGRILGNLSSMFRYYSCIFHISDFKQTTGRAILNKVVNVPFTYTIQSSNGIYYDNVYHVQRAFKIVNFMQMGTVLFKALQIWNKTKILPGSKLSKTLKFMIDQDDDDDWEQFQDQRKNQKQILLNHQKASDDQIQQGKSDSQPSNQDFNQIQLFQLQKEIQGKNQQTVTIKSTKKQKRGQWVSVSPQKSERRPNGKIEYDWSQNLRQCQNMSLRKQVYKLNRQRLPPVITQDKQIKIFGTSDNDITSCLKILSQDKSNSNLIKKKMRFSISQLMLNPKQVFNCVQNQLLLQKRIKKNEIIEKMRKKR